MDTPDPKERQCTATAKGSRQRCKRRPILGGTVCVKHGGGAPQVQAAARIRLAELVEPAIGALARLVRETKDKKVALGAARDILDRNDLTGKTKVEHTGKDGAPLTFTLSLDAPERDV